MVTVATRERADEKAALRQGWLFDEPDRKPNKALDAIIDAVADRLRELQARAKLAQTHQSRPVKIEQLEAIGDETAKASKLIEEAIALAKAGEEAQ